MKLLPRPLLLAAAACILLINARAETLYVSNASDSKVLRIDPSGIGAPFVTAGVDTPFGLAFDGAGNLYVANNGTFTILKFTPAGVGTTFATNPFNTPLSGLAFDSAGNLYASSNAKGEVLRYAPDGSVSVFANAGVLGGWPSIRPETFLWRMGIIESRNSPRVVLARSLPIRH